MDLTIFFPYEKLGINPLQLIERLENVSVCYGDAMVDISTVTIVDTAVMGKFQAIFLLSSYHNALPGAGLEIDPRDLKQAVVNLASKGGQVVRDLVGDPGFGVHFHISCW